MKKNLYNLLLATLFLGSLVWMTGCYTQVGTTRDEYTPRDENRDEYSYSYSDTSNNTNDQGNVDNGYYDDDNWAPAYRYGFDYYYPTLGFSFGAYDPWWRYGGWYYYDPFVCGTYYPAIYAGWHYWYPPVFYHYPYYGSHFYAGGGGKYHGTLRTVGSTRGGGDIRGGRGPEGVNRTGSSGVGDLPASYRTPSGTRNTPPGNSPRVSTGRRNDGSRAGSGRGSAGVRGGSTRGGKGKAPAGQPRTYTPPANGGNRGGSYAPPASRPPAQSTPPPSGGGRSSGGGGGGGARGGRSR